MVLIPVFDAFAWHDVSFLYDALARLTRPRYQNVHLDLLPNTQYALRIENRSASPCLYRGYCLGKGRKIQDPSPGILLYAPMVQQSSGLADSKMQVVKSSAFFSLDFTLFLIARTAHTAIMSTNTASIILRMLCRVRNRSLSRSGIILHSNLFRRGDIFPSSKFVEDPFAL